MKIYLFRFFLLPSLYPSLHHHPRCSSSFIREGVLTSPDAEVWPNGWSGGFQGPTWYATSMSLCVCACGCVYCLRHDFCRLGEGCTSDKGCWLSLADPHRPSTSCQSHGPQRGAFPSALPQPGLAQQDAG